MNATDAPQPEQQPVAYMTRRGAVYAGKHFDASKGDIPLCPCKCAALAQQAAQEPQPAGFDYMENGQFVRHFKSRTVSEAWVEKFGGKIIPLYAAPLPSLPRTHGGDCRH